MSETDERDLMGPLLGIASEIISRGHATVEAAEMWLRSEPENLQTLTLGDQIVTALALKMLATFESLVEDAKRRRGEAMHHLKTLCEAFIYLYEAAASEERAKLVLAYALTQRSNFWCKNPGPSSPEMIAGLEAEIADLGQGRRLPDRVATVAKQHANLPGWYNRVYRLACEPAHISDLDDFFPDEQGGLPHGVIPAGAWRAHVALRYALRLMFGLGHFLNETNRIGLVIEQADLEARFEETSGQAAHPEDGA